MVFIVTILDLTVSNFHTEIRIFLFITEHSSHFIVVTNPLFSCYFLSNQEVDQKYITEAVLLYTGTVDVYTGDTFVFAFIRHVFDDQYKWHSLLFEYDYD